MKNLLLITIILATVSAVFAQDTKKSLPSNDEKRSSPSEEHLMLRNELEKDKTVMAINCGLLTEVDLKNPNSKEILKSQKENSRVKLLLYQAAKSDDKTLKAKYTCLSDSGSEVINYLFVEKGKARIFEDLSRDSVGGYRINRVSCTDLQIGYLTLNKDGNNYDFKAFEDQNYEEKPIVLQCKTPIDRVFIF